MKKILVALPIFALMTAFAVIQWFRLAEGGHAFTTTPAQLMMWSASHIALMALTGLCIIALHVSTGRAKVGFGFAVAFLAAVQIVGAYVGLGNTAAASDVQSDALLRQAQALERKASDIRAATAPIIIGLSQSAATSSGKAGRDRIEENRAVLASAGDYESQAAELRARAGVTSTAVGGRLADVLLFAMTIATELGFAICAHLLALIFGNQIASVFNNLQRSRGDEKPGK